MKINRFDNESNVVFNYRKRFIEMYKEECDDINTVIKYSKILANIKFKKLTYDPLIHNKLIKYINI
jgi:hypothetical protein